MSRLKEKHALLEFLYNTRDEISQSGHYDIDFPPDFRKACLSANEIHEKLKYSYNEIEVFCHVLMEAKQISRHESCPEDHTDETFYSITLEGKRAYLEKVYLNQIWWRSQKFWFNLLPIAIALAALVVSIIALVNDPSCQ